MESYLLINEVLHGLVKVVPQCVVFLYVKLEIWKNPNLLEVCVFFLKKYSFLCFQWESC